MGCGQIKTKFNVIRVNILCLSFRFYDRRHMRTLYQDIEVNKREMNIQISIYYPQPTQKKIISFVVRKEFSLFKSLWPVFCIHLACCQRSNKISSNVFRNEMIHKIEHFELFLIGFCVWAKYNLTALAKIRAKKLQSCRRQTIHFYSSVLVSQNLLLKRASSGERMK